MSKLIILDRDGVINEDSDHYIRNAEQWQPIPGSIAAIAQLSQAGYRIAVATNQSGLARGFFNEQQLQAMHAKLNRLVIQAGGEIAAIRYCPHHPDDHCRCRKPEPGMLVSLLEELNCPAGQAWMVGDSLKDIQAGQAAGCRCALVKTGKGMRTVARGEGLHTIPVFENLSAFCHQLLSAGH